MKNMKMGLKLSIAFGFLIMLSIILGGMAIGIMITVKNSAVILAEAYVPEVKVSNDMERRALEIIDNMNLYTRNDKAADLVAAKKSMAELKRQLTEAYSLASQNILSHRQKDLDNIQRALANYETMTSETEAINKELRNDRKAMDEAAGVYMAPCISVLGLLRQAKFEVSSNAIDMAAQEKQIKKIYLINDAIDLGNSIRVANFKSQVQRDSASLKAVLKQFDAIDMKIAELQTVFEQEKHSEQLAEIQKAADAYKTAMTALEASWISMDKLNEKRDQIETNVLEMTRQFANSGMQNTIKVSQQSVNRLTNASRFMLIGLIIIALIGIIATIYLTRMITVPLQQGVAFARKIATGDFTQKLEINRRDEIGLLANALNDTVTSLRQQIQETTKAVNVIASTASEISTSVSQVAAGSTETATAVSETTTTVEEVKQTSLVTTEKAKVVLETASRAARDSQTGQQSAAAAIEGMNHIRQQMETIAESIVRLSEQSLSISEIISSVDDIAEQSNLLAVNASIEAAKAGEQGKGFAVVAQEIKSLAGQSKQSTEKIRNILNDIQKATSAAVMATEQGSKAVEAGVKQSSQTGEAISLLAGQAQEASKAAIQIAASSQQQLTGMDQIALAMENIKTASDQNVESMEQLKTAAGNLQELGGKLKEAVEQFKI